MELTELPTEYVITPFPDDPESWLRCRILGDVESARIMDAHKVQPGAKNSMSKFSVAARAIARASLTAWGPGWTKGGKPIPVCDAEKDVILDAKVIDPADGEVKAIASIIAERIDARQRELLGNSEPPSRTGSDSMSGTENKS